MDQHLGRAINAKLSFTKVMSSLPSFHHHLAGLSFSSGKFLNFWLFGCVSRGESKAAADLAGTAIFAFTGGLVSFRQFKPAHPGIAWVAGVVGGFLTAVGGGVLRDLLRMRLPVACLTPYGWIAGLGAAFHFALFQTGVPLAWVVSGAFIYLLAEAMHRWDGWVGSLGDREGLPYGLVPLN